MYEFITHTWNTVKGQCYHDCSYCYMKRWGHLKPVRFDRSELKTDLGKDNYIFVGSSCDMFADNIPVNWIMDTINHCIKYDDNKYLFQSKNTKVLAYLPDHPIYSTFCTTIETNRWYEDIMRNSPRPMERAYHFNRLSRYYPTFLTIEPILDFDLKEFIDVIKLANPRQVNIGADSGRNNLPEPPKEKVLELISELEKFTIIHNKKNVKRIINN